ncbi:MAG TPA: cell division FtsA domain-containing protein [Candidatus Paceibacterota bacterium]|nr:cell division FtsA domain-containing protein [Candidatus Paceibacterota bacterium]
MAQKIYTGIDIGTHQVKVVIAAPPQSPESPMQILATAAAASKGMRHGYIVDTREVARSVRAAVDRAAQAAHVHVKAARVAVGGISLEEARSAADITLTASGGLVTPRDIERVIVESEKRATSKLTNRVVLHTIPLEFRLDGVPLQGRPTGMQGNRLGVETMLITMLAQHHDDLIEAVEAAGVEVDGVMASPLAASLVTLSKAQKTAGVVLANIGSETLSVVVFDDDKPVSLKIFPVGSNEITNAIALSFQMPLAEAEQLKRGAVVGSPVPPKKLSQVMASRLKEMFSLVNAHLKSIGRERLLPAGIVITGGGAGLAPIVDVARATLKLPAQVGLPMMLPRVSALDATWAVSFGLCRWGYAEDMLDNSHPIGDIVSRMLDSIKQIFRSLLP